MVVSRGRVRGIAVLSAFLVLLLSQVSYSADSGRISGTILDKFTSEPLQGAIVHLLGTRLGAQADVDGKFLMLAVPTGTHTLQVTLRGYKDVVFRDVQVAPDSVVSLQIAMGPRVLNLRPVEVVGERPLLDSLETGRIAGTVRDKKTKEGLPGAHVLIKGTLVGALTDLDGRCVIRSVPVGTCSLMVIMVGYTREILHNVCVSPDSTTDVKVDLKMSKIEMPRMCGEPPMIDISEGLPRNYCTFEDLKNLPVATAADVLQTQAGVKSHAGEFHIRGGRSDEFLYIVDGVVVNDPLGGAGPIESLDLSANDIGKITVYKGVVPVEYDGAGSGIVEIATKDGHHRQPQTHLAYLTDNLGTNSLNTYSNSYDRLEFAMSGPLVPFIDLLFPVRDRREPWRKLSYFISADFDRSNSYTPINDYNTTGTRMDFGSTKFIGLNIHDRQENYGNVNVKLSYWFKPNIRLTGIVMRSRERSLLWDWRYRYTANTMPWIEDGGDRCSLNLRHWVSPRTWYSVTLSRFERTYEEMPGDPNVAGGRMSPDQFLFPDEGDHYTDTNQNGVYDSPEEWLDQYADGQYNGGDVWEDRDADGVYTAGTDILVHDFNGNGRYDASGGEAFADRNGNHVWDDGDPLEQDGNGNGVYDPERERDMFGPSANDRNEPFIDGDRSRGEPYVDVNKNGRWDADYTYELGGRGEPFTDLSGDSKYQGPNDPWVPGIPYDDLNGNGVYDRGTAVPSGSYSTNIRNYNLGDPFVDLNGNGRLDAGDGFFDRGWEENPLWHKHTSRILTIDADITHQAGRRHELKAGFKYSGYNLTMAEIEKPNVRYRGLPDPSAYAHRGIRRDIYTQTPKAGAVYVRDKLEYGQLNANIGLRYDYFIQSNIADFDVKESSVVDAWGNITIYDKTRHELAPRLLFWYPVAHYAKVFFNYGHFYQMPQFAYMYRRSTVSSSEDYAFGNVNLDYKKTVEYECGAEAQLWWDYLLSSTVYYRDDYGRIGLAVLPGWASYDGFTYFVNVNDTRSRGVEIELRKRYGHYTSWSVAYDYAYVSGRMTGGSRDLFGNIAGWGYIDAVKEIPLDWDQRHAFTLIWSFTAPLHSHPKLFGLHLPDGFGLNVLWRYGSGYPYSPGSQHPGVSLEPGGVVESNSFRLPATSTVDVRFNKHFRVGRAKYTFQVWVMNLFDRHNVMSVGSQTGRPETMLNMGGIPYLGSIDPDPRNWGPGRQVRVGVGVDF